MERDKGETRIRLKCESCRYGTVQWYPSNVSVYCARIRAAWGLRPDALSEPNQAPHWCPRVLQPELPGMEAGR